MVALGIGIRPLQGTASSAAAPRNETGPFRREVNYENKTRAFGRDEGCRMRDEEVLCKLARLGGVALGIGARTMKKKCVLQLREFGRRSLTGCRVAFGS